MNTLIEVSLIISYTADSYTMNTLIEVSLMTPVSSLPALPLMRKTQEDPWEPGL
jgi:hypothetical protein